MFRCNLPAATACLMLFIIACPTTEAQDTWTGIYQSGHFSPLDIIALRDGGFLAVGDSGTIFRKPAAQSFWTVEHLDPQRRMLRSIAMRDSLRGLVAGEGGVVMATFDEGSHWTPLPSFTDHTILKMHFWTSDSGLALTARGGIWQTDDGGFSWRLGYQAVDDSLFDVVHAGGGKIFVCGEKGTLLRSLDDGKSWGVRWNMGTSSFYCLAISPDSVTLALAGLGGYIWHTTDRGGMWYSDRWTHNYRIKDVWFFDRYKLRVVSEYSLYNVHLLPYKEEHTWGRAEHAIGAERNGVIQLLGDNGTSACLLPGATEWISPVYMFWGRRSVVLPDGARISWTDGGTQIDVAMMECGLTSYRRVKSMYSGNNRATCYFSCYDRLNGIMVQNLSGREHIYASSDGFATWQLMTNARIVHSGGISSLACVSPTEVFACYRGGVQRSTDRGATWTTAFTPRAAMNCIAFSQDKRTGAVAGGNGYLYVTNDWGAHWEEYRAPSKATFTDVEVRNNVVAAIGSGGCVFVSQYYGETWEEHILPVSGNLQGLCVASAEALFVCCDHGDVFSTRQRGGAWQRETLPATSSCKAIEALNDGTLLVVTEGLKYFRKIEEHLLDVQDGDPSPAFAESTVIGSPWPQPASRQLCVPVSLPRAAELRLELFDMLGRKRAVLFAGNCDSGRNTLAVEIPLVEPGCYLIQARSKEGATRKRIQILY